MTRARRQVRQRATDSAPPPPLASARRAAACAFAWPRPRAACAQCCQITRTRPCTAARALRSQRRGARDHRCAHVQGGPCRPEDAWRRDRLRCAPRRGSGAGHAALGQAPRLPLAEPACGRGGPLLAGVQGNSSPLARAAARAAPSRCLRPAAVLRRAHPGASAAARLQDRELLALIRPARLAWRRQPPRALPFAQCSLPLPPLPPRLLAASRVLHPVLCTTPGV